MKETRSISKTEEVRINILGTSFTIQTDENPQYVYQLVEYYKQKIAQVRSSSPTIDALKAAVLAGILLADEALKYKPSDSTIGKEQEEIAHLTNLIINKLEDCLKSDQ